MIKKGLSFLVIIGGFLVKIHIEIVTGFLGAGKTTFINSLLSETQVEGERIFVFQLEKGKVKITQVSNINSLIKTIEINEIKELNEEMIFSIKEHKPHRIIIEYNGTSSLKDLFNILNEKIYREVCRVTTIFFVADGKKLNEYIDNIGEFIVPCVQYADMVVVNNTEECNKKVLEKGLEKIKNINPKAYVLKVKNKYMLKSTIREAKILDNSYLKKIKIKFANYK